MDNNNSVIVVAPVDIAAAILDTSARIASDSKLLAIQVKSLQKENAKRNATARKAASAPTVRAKIPKTSSSTPSSLTPAAAAAAGGEGTSTSGSDADDAVAVALAVGDV